MAEGTALGLIGANVANKAANIYGTYLETDSERKREIFLQSAARAEALQAAAPDFVNAYYFHAQALGRYSQEISVVKALAQGIGGRVKASLDKAIRLEPNHADAHIALGSYHAEVVSKVGAMLAKLTYGASKEEALKHFALARKLLPDSAIARRFRRQEAENAGSAQKFLSTHAAVYNTFNAQRHLTSAQSHHVLRAAAMTTWREAVAAA